MSKRSSRSTPPVSIGTRAVVLSAKLAVLCVCAVLDHREAMLWYRHWREWLDERSTDKKRPVTAWRLLRECFNDFCRQLPEEREHVDPGAAIYNLIDRPMEGLVFWAVPAGSITTIAAVGFGASDGPALFGGFVASALTWSVYIGYRLRQRINEDLADPKPVVRGDPRRVFTLPNAVSSARLVLSPPLLVSAAISRRLELVAVVLAACLVSDWLDGWLARKRGEITDLGAWLDRMADRSVVLAVAGSLLFIEVGPAALLVLALGRDLIVGSSTIALAVVHKKPAPVSPAGKVGFVLLITGLILYLLVEAGLSWLARDGSLGGALHVTATSMASVGLGLRYLSAWQQLSRVSAATPTASPGGGRLAGG